MSDDDFLWRHLQDLPAFRALLRAVEARFYQDLLPLAEPVLDVGCGDGHFASVAFPEPLAAGIDPAPPSSARRGSGAPTGCWPRPWATPCPSPTASFATVISNSVLEHIPAVEPVLAEIARVLQPGGRFIFCVPGDRFTELLFFPQLFRSLRLEGLARPTSATSTASRATTTATGRQVWEARLDDGRACT